MTNPASTTAPQNEHGEPKGLAANRCHLETSASCPVRIRPPAKNKGISRLPDEGDAPDDARGARSAVLTDAEPITADAFPIPLDDDLRRLLDAWLMLSADDRRALADHALTLSAGRLD